MRCPYYHTPRCIRSTPSSPSQNCNYLHSTMAASVETIQNQTTGGRRRYRNRGQKKAGSDTTQNNTPSSDIVQQTVEENGTVSTAEETVNSSDETDICFICAEKVKYYSVSECNHRTCHVCALRLRALYKKKECTFCNLEVCFELLSIYVMASFKYSMLEWNSYSRCRLRLNTKTTIPMK